MIDKSDNDDNSDNVWYDDNSFRETMIDHMEIVSSIIARNSTEGKKQLERELEKGEGSHYSD